METEVIKTEQEFGKLNDFQLSAIKDAEEKLENLRKELSTKKYLIDVKKEDIKLVSEYINNDAPWKFTECLGIIEVDKQLQECLKTGKLFTTAVAIEAIYYYMSKVEGKGKSTDTSTFTSLADYLRILKAMTAGLEKIKVDTNSLKDAEFVVAARREGVEPDPSLIS